MNIDQTIPRSGLTPIQRRWYTRQNDCARDMMAGRTHYYDDSTLRFFACRVQSIRLSENGVYMATIATQKRGFDDTSREYKIAVHDLTGYTLETSDLGTLNTRKQADKAMVELLARLDELQILRDAIKREKVAAVRNLQQLRSVKL